MSHDASVWRKGSKAMAEVTTLAASSLEHRKLFNDYKAHVWSDWRRKEDGSPDYNAGKIISKPPIPQEKAFRTGESS
jgi:hypothetical protein